MCANMCWRIQLIRIIIINHFLRPFYLECAYRHVWEISFQIFSISSPQWAPINQLSFMALSELFLTQYDAKNISSLALAWNLQDVREYSMLLHGLVAPPFIVHESFNIWWAMVVLWPPTWTKKRAALETHRRCCDQWWSWRIFATSHTAEYSPRKGLNFNHLVLDSKKMCHWKTHPLSCSNTYS